MLEEIKELRRAINEVSTVVDSEAEWDVKFNLVFGYHKIDISNLLHRLNLWPVLNWEDCDTSYENDVMTYYRALLDLDRELVKITGEES